MRGNPYIIKTAKLLLFAALLLTSAFLFVPSAKTALTLPIVGCESQQDDFSIYGVSQHLTSGMSRENGVTSFTYGSDNNSFVSTSGNKILFDVSILFAPDNSKVLMKLYAFDRTCNPVFGFGPSFSNLTASSPNLASFNKDNYDVELNGESQTSRPSGAIRYLWVEVWNGKTGDEKKASYSYLVDIDNLQNPSGTVGDAEPPGKRPVLIIPGIMGSKLYNGKEFIWPNIERIFFNQKDRFVYDNLRLDENGNSIELINSNGVVKKIVNQNIFEDLELKISGSGYDFSYFPYDWRLDIDSARDLLEIEIENIKSKTRFKKVDIIAHSMGGLLVQSYLKKHGSNDINKLIFVGTPHLGAPKAAKALLFGDLDISNTLLNWDTIKELSLNSPSVYQLLPSETYFNLMPEYLWVPDQSGNFHSLNYTQSMQYLKDINLNSGLIDKAVEFQNNINNFNKGEIDIYICKARTFSVFQQAMNFM